MAAMSVPPEVHQDHAAEQACVEDGGECDDARQHEDGGDDDRDGQGSEPPRAAGSLRAGVAVCVYGHGETVSREAAVTPAALKATGSTSITNGTDSPTVGGAGGPHPGGGQ